MEIEYKNDDMITFWSLVPNAAFIHDGDLYIKTEEFSEHIIGGSNITRNSIRLKDLAFYHFNDDTQIKPVKAKVVVEDL